MKLERGDNRAWERVMEQRREWAREEVIDPRRR